VYLPTYTHKGSPQGIGWAQDQCPNLTHTTHTPSQIPFSQLSSSSHNTSDNNSQETHSSSSTKGSSSNVRVRAPYDLEVPLAEFGIKNRIPIYIIIDSSIDRLLRRTDRMARRRPDR